MQRAARWQILRNRPPLAAGAQHIHQAVHHLPQIDRPLTTAPLARWDEQLDQIPLGVCQIAGVTEAAAVITAATLIGHMTNLQQIDAEPGKSQPIHRTQKPSGQTFRLINPAQP